jgi:uncharacterized RDD family membrane protein YckC
MDNESTVGAPAGLFRRLAALFYDLLLVIALGFIVTFAMLPFTQGEAILTETQGFLGHAYHASLAVLVFAYFGWSWTRSGQTLGMRAWRIRLESGNGAALNWFDSLVRFLFGAGLAWLAVSGAWHLSRGAGSTLAHVGAAAFLAPLALNYVWILFDSEGRSLQDLAGSVRTRRIA